MISKRFDIKSPWDARHDVYDFDAIESVDEFRTLAENANVIGYKCTETDAQGFVYGVELLRAIAHEMIPPPPVQFLVFALDSRTAALEKLIAAVQVVKGSWPSTS